MKNINTKEFKNSYSEEAMGKAMHSNVCRQSRKGSRSSALAALAAVMAFLTLTTATLSGCGAVDPSSSEPSANTQTSTENSTSASSDKNEGTSLDKKGENNGQSTTAAKDGSSEGSDKIGIDKETAIANVKELCGADSTIVSCTKGHSPVEGFDCWVVTVTPANSSETVTYYSGYQFCYKAVDDQQSDGQNPMMNFIGNYTNGRAMMYVSCVGINEFYNCGDDVAKVLKSAAETVFSRTIGNEISQIKQRLKNIDQARNDFVNLIATGATAPDSLDDEFARLYSEEEKLSQKLLSLKSQGEAEQNEIIDNIKTDIDNASFELEEYDDVLVRKVVECVKILSKEEISVTFKGGYEVKAELEPISKIAIDKS